MLFQQPARIELIRMLESRAARGWRFIEGSPGVQILLRKPDRGGSLLSFFWRGRPPSSILNADRALHYDLFEAYAWGKEFQLGYNQHGPFWAWIAGAWFLLFPNTNTSFVLLQL